MLKVYAHPASQPARSVMWLCIIKGLSFELEPDYRKLRTVNGRGQMPVIDDDGFVLNEMAAIMCYLSDKYEWYDVYPKNIQTRGSINAYLHAHHSLTRLATMKLMAPFIHSAFGKPQLGNPYSYIFNICLETSMSSNDRLTEGHTIVEKVIAYLDKELLDNHNYVAGNDQPSIADIACYDEIGQLEYANLFDFSDYTNISSWMERIRRMPYHDTLHVFNTSLGDIKTSPNTLPRFELAIATAMEALANLDSVDVLSVA